jgi:transcriptional regulator GlxA family with amidase domain
MMASSSQSDICHRQNGCRSSRQIVIATESSTRSLDVEALRHVFLEANRCLADDHAYVVRIVHAIAIASHTNCQERCVAGLHHFEDISTVPDTLFITDPDDRHRPAMQRNYLPWLREHCSRSRRIVGVAGGIFTLGVLGLLDGLTAVSHWSLQGLIKSKYPLASIRSDILYTQDRNIYTAAGALGSVDLALRLVEDDLGCDVAREIAKRMLLPFRRTSSSSQVSIALRVQASGLSPITDLLAWLPDNLTLDLSIRKLARKVAMSPRNFARTFLRQVGLTPGKYIEEIRFEAARQEITRAGQTVAGAAQLSGFKNAETLRRLFIRKLGMTPSSFRVQHSGRNSHADIPVDTRRSIQGSSSKRVMVETARSTSLLLSIPCQQVTEVTGVGEYA